jgi:hypothetical protein
MIIDYNPFKVFRPKPGKNEIIASHVDHAQGYVQDTFNSRPTQMVARAPGGAAIRSGDGVKKVYRYSILR